MGGGTGAGLLFSRLSAQEGQPGAKQHPHGAVLKGSQSQEGSRVNGSNQACHLTETQFPHLANGERRYADHRELVVGTKLNERSHEAGHSEHSRQ